MPRSRPPSRSTLVAFAHELADLTDKAVMPHFRKRIAVTNKDAAGGFDPVTAADRAAERVVRKAIRDRFPDHAITGEEFGSEGGSDYRWLIDPIDGTRAFIIGAPLWGTLIGLQVAGAPCIGLMSQPFTSERFWSDGRVSRWSGPEGKTARLRTRACAALSGAVLTSTHPDLFSGTAEKGFAALRRKVRMTRYGGDCYGYCLLAAGHVDLVVEAGLKPYDIVPLIPIIKSAGGVVTTWEGGPATDGGSIVAAGDRRLHRETLAVLQAACA
ncbi:MAG: histidinol-phosphatase [Hyphomicrobiaceae bacterium]|nr:histidinol-phosphatase [Hyphomicrobiaceae bacterium]